MDFWFLIRFLLTVSFVQCVCSLPAACSYNGTAYKEGEVIATEEPCLFCTCRKGSLVCNLRVCADLPEIPSPGCFVVHKPNDCCPQLLCEETYTQTEVELRTAITGTNILGINDCLINGSVYAEGSAVASAEVCEYCYCIRGDMKCIKPRCHLPFEGCKAIYQHSSCCPTYYDCRGTNFPAIQTENHGCTLEGVRYREGEAVPSSNTSKCERCYCMKGDVRCIPFTCSMEYIEDCEPLRTSDECCPTGFACVKTISEPSTNSVRSLEINNKTEEVPHKVNETTKAPSLGENLTSTPEETSTEHDFTTATLEEELTTPMILAKAADKKTDSSNLTFSSFQTTTYPFFTETTEEFTEKSTTEAETTTMVGTSQTSSAVTNDVDFEVQTRFNFSGEREVKESEIALDEVLGNSSQTADEYIDTYDYGDPQLPPSLPNLVIYPFVAADAVVKNEEVRKTEVYEDVGIKRVDAHPVFYNEFFNPPVKTEGGFVPKEPPAEAFYEYPYNVQNQDVASSAISGVADDGRFIPDITTPPPPSPLTPEGCFSEGRELRNGEQVPGMRACTTCVCLRGEMVCREAICPTPKPGCIRIPDQNSSTCCGTMLCDSKSSEFLDQHQRPMLPPATIADFIKRTPNPFEDVIKTESAPDLSLMGEPIPYRVDQPPTKPVTVTYKNVVVDYYPEYLITTTRSNVKNKDDQNSITENHMKTFYVHASTATEEDFAPSGSTTASYESVNKNFTEAELNSNLANPKERISVQPSEATTGGTKKPTAFTEDSFVDEFLKSFLDEKKPTTITNTKHKYSSKIRGPPTTSSKPTAETFPKKVKIVNGMKNDSSFSLFDLFFPSRTTTETAFAVPSTESVIRTATVTDDGRGERGSASATESETLQGLESRRNGGPPELGDFREPSTPSLGNLLKLAGCNIYGRMYRVGKVIAELSGPCLECVCTDLGVQCNPLRC